MRAVFSGMVLALMVVQSTRAQTPSSNTNAPRLTIELRDGSRVVGRPMEDKLQVHSDVLGDLQLPLSGISSVVCDAKTNLATVKTIKGDTLAVEIGTKTIHITTSFGDLNLATDSIRRMDISRSVMSGGAKNGMVALWSGEGSGAGSAGGPNAMLVNAVSFGPGKRGQAFFLDGTSYLKVRTTPEMNVGNESGLTVECWVNPATADVQMPVIEYEQILGSRNGSDVGVHFYVNLPPLNGQGPGSIMANVVDSGHTISHVINTRPNLVVPGVWQHIALTYDKSSGEAVIYMNSQAVATRQFGSFTPATESAYLLIGAKTCYGTASNPSDAFTGGLDEIAIYNRALSAAEIQAIYTEENTGGGN